jgi:saccharopine dehydrogenase-like NADP-dependent oxidoreductase
MNNVIILGAGQIGQAVFSVIHKQCRAPQPSPQTLADILGGSSYYAGDRTFVGTTVQLWDMVERPNVSLTIDFTASSVDAISVSLIAEGATHVINALPFTFNSKVAQAAFNAGCNYIDFTEDDVMAEAVQAIYAKNPSLTCAVKCGLAPGFINYLGHDLVKKIDNPEKLLICVGALPRNVSFADGEEALNYNLSWSIDGLVNEYLQPCNVRMDGVECQVPALSGLQNVIIEGARYEAAFTSGGIGSLVKELSNVPNVYYKTLRYPGHYAYVKDAVARHSAKFEQIKQEFTEVFPFNKDDMIVVYAECEGRMSDQSLRKETFSAIYKSANGLSAIQSTTSGGGVAILELMLKNKISGIVNHADIPFGLFANTETYQQTYFKK